MRRLRAWLVTSSRGPRVTDRPYYGGPPFSGLTAIRRAGAKLPCSWIWKRILPVADASVRGLKSPRWSAERRTLPLEPEAAAAACGPTSLARSRVPLHPSACRRSASLIGLRDKQTSEEIKPREKDDACGRARVERRVVLPG